MGLCVSYERSFTRPSNPVINCKGYNFVLARSGKNPCSSSLFDFRIIIHQVYCVLLVPWFSLDLSLLSCTLFNAHVLNK